MLIGTNRRKRSNAAWRQVYRAIEHGFVKNVCTKKNMIEKFPAEIVDFSVNFRNLQERRHSADYDPSFKLARSEVENDINVAEASINKLDSVEVKDRRAFAAYVLLKQRD